MGSQLPMKRRDTRQEPNQQGNSSESWSCKFKRYLEDAALISFSLWVFAFWHRWAKKRCAQKSKCFFGAKALLLSPFSTLRCTVLQYTYRPSDRFHLKQPYSLCWSAEVSLRNRKSCLRCYESRPTTSLAHTYVLLLITCVFCFSMTTVG